MNISLCLPATCVLWGLVCSILANGRIVQVTSAELHVQESGTVFPHSTVPFLASDRIPDTKRGEGRIQDYSLFWCQEGWLFHLGNQVNRKQSWTKSPQSQVPQQPTASSETLLLKGSSTSTLHQPVGEPFTFKPWCPPKLQAWSGIVSGILFLLLLLAGFLPGDAGRMLL